MDQAKHDDLPPSSDPYWEGEKHAHKGTPIEICSVHTREHWHEATGYLDNRDGTVSCRFCPWGTTLPGYLRVLEGRVIDLRTLNHR